MRGLQQIIDIGYQVLGNPMFVSDMGYNVLAFNKNAVVGDLSWPAAKSEEEFAAYERIKNLMIAVYLKGSIAAKAPVLNILIMPDPLDGYKNCNQWRQYRPCCCGGVQQSLYANGF